MEELIMKYILQAGALGVLVYVVYSDRLDRKGMLELYSGIKQSLDALADKISHIKD
jgi:hypothetical protein